MTPSARKPTQTTGAFLTSQEQSACKRLTKGAAPHSQRAIALLALHHGRSQLEAAKESGLSARQVKYWISRFRSLRLAIFSEVLEGTGKGQAAVPPKAEAAVTPKEKKGQAEKPEGKMGKKSKGDGKKGKKDKKGKKKKKDKKKAGKGKKK
jgi:hypothetical protein